MHWRNKKWCESAVDKNCMSRLLCISVWHSVYYWSLFQCTEKDCSVTQTMFLLMWSGTKAAEDKIDLVSKSQLPWDKKVTETPLTENVGKEMGFVSIADNSTLLLCLCTQSVWDRISKGKGEALLLKEKLLIAASVGFFWHQHLGNCLNLVIFLQIWKKEVMKIDFGFLTSLNINWRIQCTKYHSPERNDCLMM